jgi:CBS domain-containing protein
MLVADLMSRSVVAISPDAPLAQAIRLMIDHRVSGLPVIDAEGRAVGMLTEGDLLRRVETGTEGAAPGWFASFFFLGRQAERYVQTHSRHVADVMTPDVTCVEEDTPLAEVVALMQRKRIKRLPVVRGKKVVGIVSRADLVRVVGESLGKSKATADDAEIRRQIMEGIAHAPWAPASVSVAVEDGIVLLDGCVFDMRGRSAIGVLAENAQGVKRVENRIICVEPTTGTLVYGPVVETNSSAAEQMQR